MRAGGGRHGGGSGEMEAHRKGLPMRFLDRERDGGVMDSSSRSSWQWSSGAGSRNGGGGVEGVLERWRQCQHGVVVVVKGSWQWQRARETKICQVIQVERRVLNL
jgi:hypothetical protein